MMTRSLITRRLFVSLASLTLLVLAVPTPGQATVARGDAVRAALTELTDSMELAVLSGEIEGYLWHVDMSDAVFAQEQRNWAADLEKRVPETFEITLSDEDLHVEGDSATVEMQMTWNMPDSKRRQVTFPARFTRGAMEDEPGAWKYAGENWEHALGEHVVALYLDGLQDHANVVVEVWPQVWSSVNERFGVAPEDAEKEPAQQVKLYKSMAHLQASIFLSYADEHGSLGGWNEPGESIKAMARRRPSQSGLRTLLSHEYGHVRTFLLGPEANAMPWWLLEGLAEFASEPFSQTRRYSDAAAKRYAQSETIAPWAQIADFEETPKQYIGHVYRQGHHMVMFVTDTFGDEKRTQWARLMAQGQSLDQATREALGLSFEKLDHDWRESLKNGGL